MAEREEVDIVATFVDNVSGGVKSMGGVLNEVFTGAFRRIGELGVNALGAASSAITDFAADSFRGALEAQAGMDAFTSALQRAGESAPITADAAADLQDKFKDLVGGSDDMVLAMQTVGLRFDKIGKDIFPRFIEQSADLATVLKMEPTKAAEILGKTLQDLSTDGVAGLGKLKLAGVQFTDQQEEQIKTLIEAGEITKAQEVLMDALAATTGGAAADAAATGAGQWAIFKETIADAGEGIMLTLMPSLTQLATDVLPKLTPVIQQVAVAAAEFIQGQLIPAFVMAVAWVQENWPTIQATISAVMGEIQVVISTILTAINEFWSVWGDEIMAVVQRSLDNVKLVWDIFSAAFQGDWHRVGELLREGWDRLWQSVQEITGAAIAWFTTQDWGQIGSDIVAGIAAGINAGAQWVMDAMLAVAQAAWDVITGFFDAHSDSRLMIGMGKDLMSGLAHGIDKNAAMPASSMAGAAYATAGMAAGAVNNYYNLTIHSGGVTNTGAEFGRMRAIAASF